MILNPFPIWHNLVFGLLILFYVTDLVSQNVEVILNRKTNMEAVIKIIEENIPEVIIIIINTVEVFDIVCWKISDKLFAVVMMSLLSN